MFNFYFKACANICWIQWWRMRKSIQTTTTTTTKKKLIIKKRWNSLCWDDQPLFVVLNCEQFKPHYTLPNWQFISKLEIPVQARAKSCLSAAAAVSFTADVSQMKPKLASSLIIRSLQSSPKMNQKNLFIWKAELQYNCILIQPSIITQTFSVSNLRPFS